MAEAFRTPVTAETRTQSLRVPPHSMQAEQSVLGGLMLDNATWDQVADRVTRRDFYRREHQLIFDAIADLAEENKPFDVVTLAEALERAEKLEEAGGLVYLGTLANETPSAANIRTYADIVREHSVVRQLISVGTQIADSGYRPEGRTSIELLDEAERRVFEIAEQRSRGGGGFAPIKDCSKTLVYRLARYRNENGRVIPERVLTREPSAELRADQKDTDSLPPYEILDPILEYFI